MQKLAVLASGEGTLLERMIYKKLPIELVLVDRECRAFDVAIGANISTSTIDRRIVSDIGRDHFTQLVLDALKRHNIDLVAMAGFMTILGPAMFEKDAYYMRVLNTHPSLLPAFPGKNAVRDTLEYGAKLSGFTIHCATPQPDHGPILDQHAVPVLPGDTEESLHERIKQHERIIYTRVLQLILSN